MHPRTLELNRLHSGPPGGSCLRKTDQSYHCEHYVVVDDPVELVLEGVVDGGVGEDEFGPVVAEIEYNNAAYDRNYGGYTVLMRDDENLDVTYYDTLSEYHHASGSEIHHVSPWSNSPLENLEGQVAE